MITMSVVYRACYEFQWKCFSSVGNRNPISCEVERYRKRDACVSDVSTPYADAVGSAFFGMLAQEGGFQRRATLRWGLGSNGTVNRLKTLRTGDPSGLRCVPQRAQLTTGDGFGHGKRVASEHVDVLVAER